MDELIKALRLPSPIQSFSFKEFPDRQIFIKRDDLIHPEISGNKWRKLKYNIKYALDNHCKGIISFGGAFSNHLYALAAACSMADLDCITFIRGTTLDPKNPTLNFLQSKGVTIKTLQRSNYRAAFQAAGLQELSAAYPQYHIIPEGGSNELALMGVQEIIREAYEQGMPEQLQVVCAVGSGATITGIAKGLSSRSTAIGMLAVNDKSLPEKVMSQLTATEKQKLHFDIDAHLGGFAKITDQLIQFVNEFYEHTNIPIEPIYTGKLLYRLRSMMVEGIMDQDKDLLVIHTGGLQGNQGYDYRFPGKLSAGLLTQ